MNPKPTLGPPNEEAVAGSAQFLTFQVGEHEIGMDIASVREIIQYSSVTTVPLLPAFVRGVINLRGAVVPVVDLASRLGKGVSSIGKKSCIVIFDVVREDESIRLGMLVDSVSEVIEIALSDIEPPPSFGTPVRRDFIRGVGKSGGRFIILLDPSKALDVDEMANLIDEAQTDSLTAAA